MTVLRSSLVAGLAARAAMFAASSIVTAPAAAAAHPREAPLAFAAGRAASTSGGLHQPGDNWVDRRVPDFNAGKAAAPASMEKIARIVKD